ncbi:B12-binding domain-containing radical SAM protein [Patescibacteria group bacterium]|nr:B12-binding domain-containing radical SAM protein [Candidatus Falkowbacteria bacterium]MBU3905511.1 B12-binding domain-containing radical SAM protein [Patescibacteria group bacterium]MCG2698253.1 B12-binding domain-containing radical SAM protein [Candidatus Parcubacteria bacterium]MBU4014715.1 B12-binding domain-containing radical SAM protein [Patescibacteria group bacterium]MBU4026618.1 B12-binding domain-containing radical SAM protein [Patescibacteria group bacterium]
MKVLFVYPNLGWGVSPCMGIATLSAVLKNKSHNVKLIYLNEFMGFPLDLMKIKGTIEDYNPDLIGFSTTTNQFTIAIEVAQFIKRKVNKKIPILFGGMHATMNPKETLNHSCVDMIILGEGEEAILELAERMQKNQDISKVKNLWLKKEKQIIENGLRPYVSLETLPFMDVAVMDYQKVIDHRNGWVDVMVTRGCPRNCTYCFNDSYKAMYENTCDKAGKYVRVDDYFKTIDGIKDILNKYDNIKAINFYDDDFLLPLSIINFVNLFKREINLPFMINAHVNSITDKNISALKHCGCDLIKIGLESGSYRIRKDVLNRPITLRQFIEKINIIKKYGVKLFTFNMIGLPTEEKEDVFETLRLNAQIQPNVVRIATFYPYTGTSIYFLCQKLNLLQKNQSEGHLTYFEKSILNFDNRFKLFLLKILRYFDCYLNYFNTNISFYYEDMIDRIKLLSDPELNSGIIQKKLQKEIGAISKNLSSDGVPHYVKKFTPYYAVRI